MKNLKYQIHEIKDEVVSADLTSKLNALRNLVADEMERAEEYKKMLVASNDQVAAYTANENIQNHFIYLAVINSIFTDVSSMIEQVEHHYNNAIDELKNASSVPSDQTKTDNAE